MLFVSWLLFPQSIIAEKCNLSAHRAGWAAEPGTLCGRRWRRGAELDSGWSWSLGRHFLLSGLCQSRRRRAGCYCCCCCCCCLTPAPWRCSWRMFPTESWPKPLQGQRRDIQMFRKTGVCCVTGWLLVVPVDLGRRFVCVDDYVLLSHPPWLQTLHVLRLSDKH